MTRTPRTVVVTLTLALALAAGGPAYAQSTPGTWTHFPPQTPTFASVVRPPIKSDGSSTFTLGSAIPVKFKLLSGPGVFLFDSVWSNNFGEQEGENGDDFAFLSFTPSGDLTFADITTLAADYAFTLGNCQGGSLRWSVTFDIGEDNGTIPDESEPDPRANDRSIFIYYGGHPNFDDCTGANNQSGVNMIGLTDLRYDTSQIGGTFYDSYANALLLAGPLTGEEVSRPALKIAGVTLALDSGWMQDEFGNFKDQSVALTGARVNDNQFAPASGALAATCDLPPAAINVVTSGGNFVEDPTTAQFKFSDVFYREHGCMYTYNLETDSLFGPGAYTVYVTIDNHLIETSGRFTLP